MTEDSIDALLAEGLLQVQAVDRIYDESLEKKEPAPVGVKIKNIVENYRSSLDYLAVRITNAYGKPAKGFVYYPLAQTEKSFSLEMSDKMPGVAEGRQDIADAVKKFQPYNCPWLKTLNKLARQNKHNELTPQTRTDRRLRQAVVTSWDPDRVVFDETGIQFAPGGELVLGRIDFKEGGGGKPHQVRVAGLGLR